MKYLINALPLLAVILIIAVSIWIGSKRKPPIGMVCRNCETYGYPVYGATKGSALITVILFCFFIIPGVIYAIWRNTGRRMVCAHCGSAALVPWDSPVGQRIYAMGQAPPAAPPVMFEEP